MRKVGYFDQFDNVIHETLEKNGQMRFRQLEQIIVPKHMAKKTFGLHLKKLVEENYVDKLEVEKQKTVYSISSKEFDNEIFEKLNNDINKLKKQLRNLTPLEKSEKILETMKILSFAEWYDLVDSEINSKSKKTKNSETIHTIAGLFVGAVLANHKNNMIKLVSNEKKSETYKFLQKQLYREVLKSYSSLKL